MAKCLLKSGRKLVVWNRSAGKCAALSADHPGAVTAVDSPSAVLAACDLVYCMLSTPDAVKAVYEMEGGVLAGVRAGTKRPQKHMRLASDDTEAADVGAGTAVVADDEGFGRAELACTEPPRGRPWTFPGER